MKKKIALLMAMVMLFGITAGSTIAWLTASTSKVENTFTVGNINIQLDETNIDKATDTNTSDDVVINGVDRDKANSYKLVPGNTYVKDPIVRVLPNSEKSYVFNLDTLFKNATVTSRYDSNEKETLANVLNGVNNAYVDIVFTIKEQDSVNPVGTFTVNAGQTLDQGAWSSGANLEPILDVDTVYELTWTIEPSNKTGTVSGINHDEAVDATVYIYNPVLTFNDSEDWLGDTLTYGAGTNYTDDTEVWKNPTTGKLSTDASVTMHGDKPDVTITCEANPTGVENGIIVTKDYVPVQATVVIKNEDGQTTNAVENTHYTVNRHTACPDCDYVAADTEEFRVHINTVSLDITKTATGDTLNVKDSFVFTVMKNGAYFTQVILQGGKSVVIENITVGDSYEVIEDTNWSWRYDCTDSSITRTMVADSTQNVFEFTNTAETPLYWLDNESQLENVWTSTGITAVYNYN